MPSQLTQADNTYLIRMHKKLTITLDEQVYDSLHHVVGRGRISQFIEDLVRSHVMKPDLDAGYREMAADTEQEKEAQEWLDGTAGDVGDEPW
jgi:predicted CopG family antitoxin